MITKVEVSNEQIQGKHFKKILATTDWPKTVKTYLQKPNGIWVERVFGSVDVSSTAFYVGPETTERLNSYLQEKVD